MLYGDDAGSNRYEGLDLDIRYVCSYECAGIFPVIMVTHIISIWTSCRNSSVQTHVHR